MSRQTMSHRDLHCPESLERLPFFLNGSLDEPERKALMAHLEGCSACRAELAETADLWEILDLHIPSWDLAARAQGLPAATWPQEEIEQHLARCASCRRELADARVAGLEPRMPARRKRVVARLGTSRERRRTWLPLAAAVLLVALAGLWLAVLDGGGGTSGPGAAQAPGDTLLHADSFESGTLVGWEIGSATNVRP